MYEKYQNVDIQGETSAVQVSEAAGGFTQLAETTY